MCNDVARDDDDAWDRALGIVFRAVAVAIGLAVLIAFLGCGSPGMVRAEAIAPLVQAVADRHDAYVAADPALDELTRGVALDSSALLRAVVEQAMAEAGE